MALVAVWVTLVAVKKIRMASGMMMMPIVLNWRERNASAPSWIALAMSCILAVPWSAARTPRTRNSATTMAASEQASAKYSQSFSELSSEKI